MCRVKPDCRICGPGDGPCEPVCGQCRGYSGRSEIIDPIAYEEATGRKAPYERNRLMDKYLSGRKFAKEGKGSRGWWLAWIVDGAINPAKLMADSGTAWMTAKRIMAKLEEEGLIRNLSKNSRPKFKLTDSGEAEYQRYKSGNLGGMPPENVPIEPAKRDEADTSVSAPDPEPTTKDNQPPPTHQKKQKVVAGRRITEIAVGSNIKITITEDT